MRAGPLRRLTWRIHRRWWNIYWHHLVEVEWSADGQTVVGHHTRPHMKIPRWAWSKVERASLKLYFLKWRLFGRTLPCGCRKALGSTSIRVDCPDHGLDKMFADLGVKR